MCFAQAGRSLVLFCLFVLSKRSIVLLTSFLYIQRPQNRACVCSRSERILIIYTWPLLGNQKKKKVHVKHTERSNAQARESSRVLSFLYFFVFFFSVTSVSRRARVESSCLLRMGDDRARFRAETRQEKTGIHEEENRDRDQHVHVDVQFRLSVSILA